MKFRSVFILLFNIFILTSFAQERYYQPVTEDISVETHTYITKAGVDLEMDIYSPSNDYEPDRPLIMYLHGGGFQSGRRDSEDITEFCKKLAGYGYAVASVSYRLTRKDEPGGFGCDCPASEKINTFNAALEDLQDATFYIIQNFESLGIDPHKIILAGSSAGAEAVLLAAYEPPVCFDLESGPVAYAGVISMAGAIADTSKIYDESAIPSLFFHGTSDNLVPYASAPHHYCNEEDPGYIILHGSYTISNQLNQLEVPYWLHTSCGAGHEMSGLPMTLYFGEIIDFCYNFVLLKKENFRHTIIKEKEQNPSYETFNFCD